MASAYVHVYEHGDRVHLYVTTWDDGARRHTTVLERAWERRGPQPVEDMLWDACLSVCRVLNNAGQDPLPF